MKACPYPIAVMSFNRPDYLTQVLHSLKNQTVSINEGQLYLFQDGVKSRFSEAPFDDTLHNECVKKFQEVFPRGNVFPSPINLGVALNFDRAERLFFDELKAECGIFFEDDLELSPYYMEALLQLIGFALQEPLVAYVAAYGEHETPLSMQRDNSAKIVPMRHKWGFALTRRQWLAQREIIQGYLSIIREREYMKRDNDRINNYFHSYGFGVSGTSQDGAKDLASLVLGTTKIMCKACFGKYIGKVGTHSNIKLYDDTGYGNTELFDLAPPRFDYPSPVQLQEWIRHQQAQGRQIKDSQRASLPKIKDFTIDTSAVEFVISLYRKLLNREADSGGLEHWVNYLRGGKSLADLVGKMTESPEYKSKLKSILVAQETQNEIKPLRG